MGFGQEAVGQAMDSPAQGRWSGPGGPHDEPGPTQLSKFSIQAAAESPGTGKKDKRMPNGPKTPCGLSLELPASLEPDSQTAGALARRPSGLRVTVSGSLDDCAGTWKRSVATEGEVLLFRAFPLAIVLAVPCRWRGDGKSMTTSDTTTT